MKKKRVLITGARGFIGSQLLVLLEDSELFTITAIDNYLSGTHVTITKTPIINGDIRDKELMRQLIAEQDYVVHLAAIVGEPACVINTDFSYDVNVIGTHVILDAMSKDQHLIFASTSSVYGNRPNERVTERSECKPINNYARQKVQAEYDILQSNIPYTILRPVTAFGITATTRLDLLVNTLIYEALTTRQIILYEPDVCRPIIHALDYARVIIATLHGTFGINEIYNIGDPSYVFTKRELVTEIATRCNAKIIQTNDVSLDTRNYAVVFDKMIATGFQCGEDRLGLGMLQLAAALPTLQKNPTYYSTPFKTQQFLEKGINTV